MTASTRRLRVTVAVLGDLGRSPRTLYHALALADSLAEVDLVGYVTSALPVAVARHAHVRVHALRSPAAGASTRLPRAAFLVAATLRVARQSVELGRMLVARVPPPDLILVQSPPAVPMLAVALGAARLRRARLVVDWHNLGHAMLALALGPRHVVVRVAAWYERTLARRADAHLCVSQAMRRELTEHWRVGDATVLYDRPTAAFAPTPIAARHELFRRLGPLRDVRAAPPEDVPAPASAATRPVQSHEESRPEIGERTLMTEITADGECRPRADRPALVVSPTSWTADEDFALLVDALARFDARIRHHEAVPGRRPFPPVLVVVTGDGPLRARYEARFRALGLVGIHVRTLWLAAEDYPRFLGCADLGISLHRSASGLDLPMKVADMLGAGVPVCALDYGAALGEQLRDGETGILFRTADELAAALFRLLRGFPDTATELDRLRARVAAASELRWEEAWAETAQPLFARAGRR
jgi:beta-1,4-mannosyltransferase